MNENAPLTPQSETTPHLLSPFSLCGVTLKSRIVMSPMCQYSAEDGMPNDWHFVHLGSRAAGGAALIMVEATAVSPEGRITPADTGIWSDAHIAPFERIVRFIESQGAVPGIQLAHAGRKASCDLPWRGGKRLSDSEGGWPVVAPSPAPFHPGNPDSMPLDEDGLGRLIDAFEAAAKRAVRAGFKLIEIHSAHGYLLHEFLSPLSNTRTDAYGGSRENRMRFPLRVAERVRRTVPDELPVLVRISATDWVEGGWDADQSVEYAKQLKALGIDLIDCSTGGLVPDAEIPVGPGFQVPFAARIRKEAGIPTSAVGRITQYAQAEEVVRSEAADLVMLGTQLLREPYWPNHAATALGAEPVWPVQYGYVLNRR